MSRKFTLSLAAALVLGSAALVAAPANAKPNNGPGMNSGIKSGINVGINKPIKPNNPGNPGKPGKPGKPNDPGNMHGKDHHGHDWYGHTKLVFIGGRWVYRPVEIVEPIATNLCTCLTKDYTPEGVVIFKDVCTKEVATTTVPGSPAAAAEAEAAKPAMQSSEAPATNNFAGRSFEDFKAGQQTAAKQQ